MPFYFRLCLSTLAVVRHVGAVIEDDFEIVEPAMAAVDGSAEGMVGEADRRETGAEGETVESVDKMDETGGDKGKEDPLPDRSDLFKNTVNSFTEWDPNTNSWGATGSTGVNTSNWKSLNTNSAEIGNGNGFASWFDPAAYWDPNAQAWDSTSLQVYANTMLPNMDDNMGDTTGTFVDGHFVMPHVDGNDANNGQGPWVQDSSSSRLLPNDNHWTSNPSLSLPVSDLPTPPGFELGDVSSAAENKRHMEKVNDHLAKVAFHERQNNLSTSDNMPNLDIKPISRMALLALREPSLKNQLQPVEKKSGSTKKSKKTDSKRQHDTDKKAEESVETLYVDDEADLLAKPVFTLPSGLAANITHSSTILPPGIPQNHDGFVRSRSGHDSVHSSSTPSEVICLSSPRSPGSPIDSLVVSPCCAERCAEREGKSVDSGKPEIFQFSETKPSEAELWLNGNELGCTSCQNGNGTTGETGNTTEITEMECIKGTTGDATGTTGDGCDNCTTRDIAQNAVNELFTGGENEDWWQQCLEMQAMMGGEYYGPDMTDIQAFMGNMPWINMGGEYFGEGDGSYTGAQEAAWVEKCKDFKSLKNEKGLKNMRYCSASSKASGSGLEKGKEKALEKGNKIKPFSQQALHSFLAKKDDALFYKTLENSYNPYYMQSAQLFESGPIKISNGNEEESRMGIQTKSGSAVQTSLDYFFTLIEELDRLQVKKLTQQILGTRAISDRVLYKWKWFADSEWWQTGALKGKGGQGKAGGKLDAWNEWAWIESDKDRLGGHWEWGRWDHVSVERERIWDLYRSSEEWQEQIVEALFHKYQDLQTARITGGPRAKGKGKSGKGKGECLASYTDKLLKGKGKGKATGEAGKGKGKGKSAAEDAFAITSSHPEFEHLRERFNAVLARRKKASEKLIESVGLWEGHECLNIHAEKIIREDGEQSRQEGVIHWGPQVKGKDGVVVVLGSKGGAKGTTRPVSLDWSRCLFVKEKEDKRMEKLKRMLERIIVLKHLCMTTQHEVHELEIQEAEAELAESGSGGKSSGAKYKGKSKGRSESSWEEDYINYVSQRVNDMQLDLRPWQYSNKDWEEFLQWKNDRALDDEKEKDSGKNNGSGKGREGDKEEVTAASDKEEAKEATGKRMENVKMEDVKMDIDRNMDIDSDTDDEDVLNQARWTLKFVPHHEKHEFNADAAEFVPRGESNPDVEMAGMRVLESNADNENAVTWDENWREDGNAYGDWGGEDWEEEQMGEGNEDCEEGNYGNGGRDEEEREVNDAVEESADVVEENTEKDMEEAPEEIEIKETETRRNGSKGISISTPTDNDWKPSLEAHKSPKGTPKGTPKGGKGSSKGKDSAKGKGKTTKKWVAKESDLSLGDSAAWEDNEDSAAWDQNEDSDSWWGSSSRWWSKSPSSKERTDSYWGTTSSSSSSWWGKSEDSPGKTEDSFWGSPKGKSSSSKGASPKGGSKAGSPKGGQSSKGSPKGGSKGSPKGKGKASYASIVSRGGREKWQ